MKFPLSLIIPTLLATLTSGRAMADDGMESNLDSQLELSSWDARQLAVVLHGGMGLPLGFGGLAIEYTPVRWFSADLGTGIGATGFQVAANARFRLPFDNFGMFALIGASGSFDDREELTSALWINSGLGLEYRFDIGVQVGFNAGATMMVACDGASHQDRDWQIGPNLSCRLDKGATIAPLAFAGFSLGYAFP